MFSVIWELEYLDGYAPVQAYGTVEGHPFYFRARGDRWRFVIAHQNAIDAACGIEEALFERTEGYGVPGGFDAGFMEHDEAMNIILTCLWQYQETCNILTPIGQ